MRMFEKQNKIYNQLKGERERERVRRDDDEKCMSLVMWRRG